MAASTARIAGAFALLLGAATPAGAQRLAYADLIDAADDALRPSGASEPEATPAASQTEIGHPFLQYALLDRFEWAPEGDSYSWDFSALLGGDTNRFYFGTSGDGAFAGRLDTLELDAFLSRAIGGDWDLNAGLRYDILPDPSRLHAALGAQYDDGKLWLGAWAYASHKGELSARIASFYNLKLAGRLFAQPSMEIGAYGSDIPALGVGRGFSYAEAGLRLRYEVADHVAPYLGLSWERSFGRTARLARAAGDGVEASSLVLGLRSEF